MEVWQDIPGFEGHYQASTEGKIRSLKRGKVRELCQPLNADGYPQLKLTMNGKSKTFRVHRLIALTFIPNPLNLPEVNHVKGIKVDNRVSELEWCDRSEQMSHAFRTGLKTHKGVNNTRHDKTIYTFYHPEHGEVKSTQYDLRQRFNIPQKNFPSLMNGNNKTCYGWQLMSH